MHFFIKKQPPTTGYTTIADGDADTNTATVPRFITHRSTLTIVRSWSGVVAIVAGMMMLVAGGAVWMRNGLSYTTATAEVLVMVSSQCVAAPMDATFGGISTTNVFVIVGKRDPFETCYQYGEEAKYCWTKSYYSSKGTGGWFQCYPDPSQDKCADCQEWERIHQDDMKYVNPVTHPYSCGLPCQDMYHSSNDY